MDLDGSRESESVSMDIDSDAVSCRHPQHCDSVEMNSSGPSSHPFPGSDIPPRVSSLSSPANHLGGDVYQNHGLARQRRDILPSLQLSIPGVTSRKRKHTHDSSHSDHDHTRNDNSFADAANSHSSRRIRPRLRIQQDREFTPLLIMSPSRERDSPMEEETIAFYYPPNMTDSSHSIRPCSHLGNLHGHGPRLLQSSSLPTDDDPEDHQERKRSDSANSLAQVTTASTTAPKHGRLSTLSDIWLPRPFDDDAEQPPALALGGTVKVHERGIDAAPSFSSTKGGRTGGLWASRERACSSPTDTLGLPIRAPDHEDGVYVHVRHGGSSPQLEPSSTNFFGKPICDSPDSIDPDEDGPGLTRR